MRKPRRPIAYAFIDSQNLNLGVQRMGWKMDWGKLRRYLRQKYNVTHAYMFIGYLVEQEAMYNQLHDQGYLIVLKPTLDMTRPKTENEEGRMKNGEQPTDEKKVIKGNIDAELVLHAMKEMPNYEKAIVVSGDGDFYCLLEYLEEKRKLLHLMTPNWRYSNLLKPFEKNIVRIDQLRRELEYRPFRKKTVKKDSTPNA